MVRAHWIHCCLVIVLATAAQAATFFVDAEEGNNANTGTSVSAPFLTIQKAVDEAAANPGPDLIQIAPGEYIGKVSITNSDKLTLSGAGDVTITTNDENKDVISITAGEVTLSSLTVTGGKVGIKARGSATSLILRDVIVSGNSSHGLDTRDMSSVTVVHASCSENGNDGIHVENVGTVSFTSTTSADNVGDGADIENTDTVRLSDVTIRDSGDDGLEVDFCGSITVLQGLYCGSGDDGLDIDNTRSISLVGVVATDNPGNGLQVESENVYDEDTGELTDAAVPIESISIRNGEFLGNEEDGINIVVGEDGAVQKLSLVSIAAEDNVQSGVEVAIDGSVKVSALKSANNGAPDILP